MASFISRHTGTTIDNAIDNFATPFSTTATYQVGNYVTYQGTFYRCITAITTPGAWDATKWEAKKVADISASAEMEWGQF